MRKEFPSLLVASAALGCALTNITISEIAEIAEHVLGHPVWTHELPYYQPAVGALVREQFPLIPTGQEARFDWEAAARKVSEAYGPTISVLRGAGVRTTDPISTLQAMTGDKPIVIVSQSDS